MRWTCGTSMSSESVRKFVRNGNTVRREKVRVPNAQKWNEL